MLDVRLKQIMREKTRPEIIQVCTLAYHAVVRVYVLFFFFQAEDGIRDVERARGVGDVYKGQTQYRVRKPTRKIVKSFR